MTNSQKKLIQWYKANSTRFDNVTSIEVLKNKKVQMTTPDITYIIGLRGGLTIKE